MPDPGTPRSAPASIEGLLENATWLRALAQQMLADRGLADDAVQETWIAALRAGPAAASERSWLARVARNFALQRGRSDSARREREHRAARPERLPSADEAVARAELHAKLVQAVLALEDPYRATILWRYFEGLSAEQIAARAGIDPATVRSRVARAREKLRAALIANGGEPPERWLAGLLPLGHTAGAQVAAAGGVLAGIGGSLMSTKLALGVGVALALAAVLVWRGVDPGVPSRSSEAAPALADASSVEAPPATPELAGAPLADLRTPAAETEPASAPGAAVPVWRGTVRSEDGLAPIAGARIAYRRGSEIETRPANETGPRTRAMVESDAQGRFEVPISAQSEDGLWIEADGHFAFKLSAGDLPRDGVTPIEVTLAPLGRIELEVVDDALAPHADLPVSYSISVNRGSQDFMWSYRRDLDAGLTDPAGRLTIKDVPCGMPIQLIQGERQSASFLGVVHVDPRERVLRHQVKLARTATIRGRALRADGSAVSGLLVEWDGYPLDYGEPERALSRDDGRFELAGLAPKRGELHLDVPGIGPLELAPGVGETVDVGELVVPELVALSGSLTSRWAGAASPEAAFEDVEIRVLRDGRVLAPLNSNEGALRLRSGAFSTAVTPGPVELLVTRGGYWYAGLSRPREVLARLSLPAPRTDVEVAIDERLGALDVALGEPGPAEGATWELALVSVADGNLERSMFSLSGFARPDGSVRFAPIAPGLYRGALTSREQGSALLGELEIAAGQATRVDAPAATSLAVLGSVRNARGEPIDAATVRCRTGSVQKATTSDAQGRFRIDGLPWGLLDLEVSHGDYGVERRRSFAVLEPETRVEFVLAGYATVVGRVRSAGAPAAGFAVHAQPVESNDTFNAITDDQGAFRIERLPACRLRLWASHEFMEVLELAAGETRALELDVGAKTWITFTKDGAPVEDLYGANVLALDDSPGAEHRWRMGELHRGGVDIECPGGRVLFEVSRARSGSNTTYVALVERAGALVELARHTLTIENSAGWGVLLPRVNLVSLAGRGIVGRWGGEIVLAVELDSEGRAVVPCLPDGARVRLSGFDSRGGRHEELVDVDGAQSLRWP